MELIFNLLKIKESGPNEDIDVGLVVQCASHRFVPNLERHGVRASLYEKQRSV